MTRNSERIFSTSAILVSLLSTACTHTAYFAETPDETKKFSHATTRNYENFNLEKELAFARSTQLGCAVVGGMASLTALILLTGEDGFSKAAIPMAVGAGGFVCAQYQGFIADRAQVYLNAAGIKVEF